MARGHRTRWQQEMIKVGPGHFQLTQPPEDELVTRYQGRIIIAGAEQQLASVAQERLDNKAEAARYRWKYDAEWREARREQRNKWYRNKYQNDYFFREQEKAKSAMKRAKVQDEKDRARRNMPTGLYKAK